MEDPRSSYDAALRGDLAPAIDLCARLDVTREEGRAWRATLDALIAFATSQGVASALGDAALEGLDARTDEARRVSAIACGHVARARVLAFDAPGLARALDRMERITDGIDAAEASGHRDVVRAWADVFRGVPVRSDLEEVVRRATHEGRAELALEAMAVRALDALGRGDVGDALTLARRASRMGRTESIPLFEHLVNLVLARVRRASGRPHLATRILAALLDVSSTPFHPWLVLELWLSRGEGAALAPDVPGARGTLALAGMLESAWQGDVDAFDRARGEATRFFSALAPLARDLALASAAIDPRVPTPEALLAFVRGDMDEPPAGLDGLAGPALARSSHAAWVLSPAEGSPRRILAPGVPLAREIHRASMLDESGVQLRTDSAIAMLGLAGAEGLEESAFFRKLYGFEYEADRHQSVRGVLYGRIRKRLEPFADLGREGGRVTLGHDAPLLAPDPRCTPPAELGILRILAERRRAAPKDVAAALGIPLRTAQDFLRRLTEDGAVRAERASRGLHYVLEDTTFSEPTRTLKGN